MQFFGICWHDTADACRSFVAEFDLPYPNALDSDESVFRAYRFNYQPATVLVTTSGKILRSHFGSVSPSQLRGWLDEVLDS